MKSENIKTIGKLAYVKLFDDDGKVAKDKYAYLDDGDYVRLFWRFYWRVF